MRLPRALLAIAALAALTACGSSGSGSTQSGSGSADARTVEIEMRDIAYSPTSVDVRAGEKVHFVFKNTGAVTHDAFIGDATAQDAHENEMRGGDMDHGTGSKAVSVKPGKSTSLDYTFNRPGQLVIGCHQPGHYTGGMKVAVNVA